MGLPSTTSTIDDRRDLTGQVGRPVGHRSGQIRDPRLAAAIAECVSPHVPGRRTHQWAVYERKSDRHHHSFAPGRPLSGGSCAVATHTPEGTVFAIRSAAEAIDALPPEHWLEHIDYLTTLVDALPGEVHLEVLDAGHAWTDDSHGQTRRQLATRTPRPVVEATRSTQQTPAPPSRNRNPEPSAPEGARPTAEQVLEDWAATVWLDIGRSIDPRLVAGADWSGLAAALDRAQHAGYDVHQHLPRLAAQQPLPPDRPARALHYRLVQECEAAITHDAAGEAGRRPSPRCNRPHPAAARQRAGRQPAPTGAETDQRARRTPPGDA